MGKPMSTVYVPDEYGRLVPTQVPTWIGFIGLYAGPEPPEGYLYCDGSAIGRETYSELFEAVGTLYGAGDGAETFNLPDARGIFFRGDGGENNAALGVRQEDAIRNITGTIGFRPMNGYITGTSRVTIFGGGASGALYGVTGQFALQTGTSIAGEPSEEGFGSPDGLNLDASRSVPTAAENRPVNLAMKPCIRYV